MVKGLAVTNSSALGAKKSHQPKEVTFAFKRKKIAEEKKNRA